MKTDDLIAALSAGLETSPPPRVLARLALALTMGLILGAAIVAGAFGVRADVAAVAPIVFGKAGFSAIAAIAAGVILARLARPGRPLGWRRWSLAVFAALAFGLILFGLGARGDATFSDALTGGQAPWCLIIIPLLATPTAALLFWLMQDMAPTRLAQTGAALGGLAGGVGAIAYSLYCPIDLAAFVGLWYSVAIGITAAIGAALGPRFLRW